MSKRYLIVGITAVAALFLYIDRVCISILADPMQTDLGLTDHQKARVLGAFFYTYALLQIPMGSLADRFGPRKVLALSIGLWSVVTAATGFVWGFAALIGVRLMLGIAEAGAYPSAAVLVKRWARPDERGRFSAAVALGGRVGGGVRPVAHRGPGDRSRWIWAGRLVRAQSIGEELARGLPALWVDWSGDCDSLLAHRSRSSAERDRECRRSRPPA